MSSRVVLGSLLTLVLLCGTVLTGCASDDFSHSTFATRHVDHEARRIAERQRRLHAERIEIRRIEAEAALAKLGQGDDRALLKRAHDVDPTVLRGFHPSDLAALAPESLRVYDLSRVLADGPDDPLRRADEDPGREGMDGERHLLERIVDLLRADGVDLFEERDAVIDVCGPCVFAVLPSAGAFGQFERLLDRLATTGGGFARVEMVLGRGSDDVPRALGAAWRTADFAAIERRLVARGPVERLVVDVPYGRERGARRGTTLSYVRDFDVDAASGLADPIIDTIVDGLLISAVYAPSSGGSEPQVAVRVTVAETVRPVPEFTTRFSEMHNGVRIQIPELRVGSYASTASPDESKVMSARVFGDRAFHVRAVPFEGTAPSPAWSRVSPADSPARRYEHPLLVNALALAATGADGADQVLFEALRLAEVPVWGQIVRPSSEHSEGVLFRWPIGKGEAATHALRAADVTSASGYGFVKVEDGYVLACVERGSSQTLARVLCRLGGAPVAGPTFELSCPEPVSAEASPGDGTSCADVSQVSFVQDFDLELADDAAIADPIVGVIQNGAVVAALPVPSAGDGVYDVHLRHTVLDGPIPIFTTGLGLGSGVTIQLPRLRHHTTWMRVRAGPGQAVPLETEIAVAADGEIRRDVRRFSLRRIR